MGRSYNIKTGLLFALLIAFLAAVLPRIIRFDVTAPRIVVINFIHLVITVFFYWLVHHFFMLQVGRGLLSNAILKPVASIVASVFCIALVTYGMRINNHFPVSAQGAVEISDAQQRFVRLFRATIVSALTYFVVYYYRMQVVLQASRFENEHLKQENLQAQLTSLKQQISPHFLFNSLNTLSSLSNEEIVKEYILNLSEVYRYVLRYQQQKEVPVKEELVFMKAYMYILKSRFEEGIKINVQVNPDKLYRKILPFSLQMLVENAIKHNSISYNSPLSISIYDVEEALAVENDLRPRTTMESPSGTGLHNLSQRYRLTGGKEITITHNDKMFKVEIPFLA